MPVSLLELFKVGLGPSSSHTMGPMTAAGLFVRELDYHKALGQLARVETTLYAALALTGRGHATDRAILAGLMGMVPESADPDDLARRICSARESRTLSVLGTHDIPFDEHADILWHGHARLPFHPNGMRFRAYNGTNALLLERKYYSVGGGFVVDEATEQSNSLQNPTDRAPYAYRSAQELVDMADQQGLSIAELALANEDALRPREKTLREIERIFLVMDECIDRGLTRSGELPGGLNVMRRAPAMCKTLHNRIEEGGVDPLTTLDWINLWAIAVNEENASGGRVVTAPTNGAAGIVPSVLRYYNRFFSGTAEKRAEFLMTATAIGGLYKANASISAAEVGCQGEVGVACSMAAASLCAVLGGSNAQIENAAEIGMEHNLGLTCDPIGGLVQIPCIERNAMGAVKAIDAARLALATTEKHHVSLDQVIDTMRRTGADMKDSYKETSLGGLAVYRPAC